MGRACGHQSGRGLCGAQASQWRAQEGLLQSRAGHGAPLACLPMHCTTGVPPGCLSPHPTPTPPPPRSLPGPRHPLGYPSWPQARPARAAWHRGTSSWQLRPKACEHVIARCWRRVLAVRAGPGTWLAGRRSDGPPPATLAHGRHGALGHGRVREGLAACWWRRELRPGSGCGRPGQLCWQGPAGTQGAGGGRSTAQQQKRQKQQQQQKHSAVPPGWSRLCGCAPCGLLPRLTALCPHPRLIACTGYSSHDNPHHALR